MNKRIETREALIKLYQESVINRSELQEKLGLSRQQVYRILCRYEKEGIKGLLHKGKNKLSNHHIE